MSKAMPATPAPWPLSSGASDNSARWSELFGCPAPQRLPNLVEQAVAWREQAMLHGDVSPAIAHDLQLAAEHALARRGLAEKGGTSALYKASSLAPAMIDGADVAGSISPPDTMALRKKASSSSGSRTAARTTALPPAASQLLPGSQLIKAYGGRNHIVAVEEGGFRYEGAVFSSLSAIAKHITGTHWNGLLFFGLRKRRSYPPKPRRHG
ncbi:DUF2924 domain-containing protein [Sphingomonas kyungheensis]|uniref:DUF2924 domain-containing protein n=1 Tax=Sphingomonas kyungheensis TaxID=1069987 RepID=A0ABU8H6M0_9SPHN